MAPFRGFLQEWAAAKAQGEQVGPSSLFFGCRSPYQDYLYEDELEEFAREGIVNTQCAFSRLDGQPKTYVQQSIKAQEDEIWPLIEAGANIYLCGDASRMAPEVEKAWLCRLLGETNAPCLALFPIRAYAASTLALSRSKLALP